MLHEFSRTELLLGLDALNKLKNAHIAVFGIGGVGSFACEALARAGIGKLSLIDDDDVSLTNRNRQLIALTSTTGKPKVSVMKERILQINPNAIVSDLQLFYTAESNLDLTQFDYVIDAIDTVTSKLFLIEQCTKLGVPIISSMGTGNKLDPTQFEVADIFQTSVCPLARVIRQECKKRNIKKLKVIYSKEPPLSPYASDEQKGTSGRPVPGSVSFVPPVAGMILAGEVIKSLCKE